VRNLSKSWAHGKQILVEGHVDKKMGLPLGIGSPGRRVSMPVSFSHRRVGSSILASLSEAGGNDLQKVTSKPLPPRSPLLTSRQLKRAHVTCYCTGRAIR
jgi:hypothetical protein